MAVLAGSSCSVLRSDSVNGAGASPSETGTSEADAATFVDVMVETNETDATVYQSLAEIEQASDVVVRARLGSATEGRQLWPETDGPGTTDVPEPALVTVVFQLEDVQLLGGNRPELLEGPFFVEAYLPRKKPRKTTTEELIVDLRDLSVELP